MLSLVSSATNLQGRFLGGQCKLDDPVSVNLFDLVDSCPLQMGAEKLTEGWRRRWVLKGCRGEVQTGGFLVARDEESVRLSWSADLQQNGAGRRLVNFLYPASGQGWSKFTRYLRNFRRRSVPRFGFHRPLFRNERLHSTIHR